MTDELKPIAYRYEFVDVVTGANVIRLSHEDPTGKSYRVGEVTPLYSAATIERLTREYETLSQRDKNRRIVAESRNEALTAELAKAREALEKARRHVAVSNSAEHLMDGFGPRSVQPSDGLLREIDVVLAKPEPEEKP